MLTSLFTRSGIYFFGLVVGKILTVIVFILYARTLQPEQFGNFIFFVTLLQVATFFADFGLVQWYQKQVDGEEKKGLLAKVISARLLTLGISLASLTPFIFLTSTFSQFITIVFVFSLIPEAFLSLFDGYYLERGSSYKVSLKQTWRMVLFLFGYLFFWSSFSINHATLIYFFSSLLVLFWYAPWRDIIAVKFISLKDSINVLKKSKHFAFLIVSSFLYSRGDSLIIRYSLGNAALGLYGGAYRYLESVSLLPTAFAHNLFPLSAKPKGVSKGQLTILTLFMLVTGIIVGLSVFFFSEFLIVGLLGDAYRNAVPLLQIFSFVIVLFFVNSPLNTVVQTSRLLNRFIPFGFANTILNIGLNIIFIPAFGIIAAAWIMFLTEITGFFINLYFVKRIYP